MTDPIRTYQFWPKSKPLPEGAKLISQFEGCHHGRYSILIEIPSLDPGASGSAGRAG